MGPTVTQPLRRVKDNEGNTILQDIIELLDNNGNSLVSSSEDEETRQLKARSLNDDGSYIPLSLKANKYIKASTDCMDVTTKELNPEGQIVNRITDLRIKLSQTEGLKTINNTSINLNNFGEGKYTKFTFDELLPTQLNSPYASLNVLIPENKYGLLLMYNNKQDLTGKGISLTATTKDAGGNDVSVALTIFNKDA
jgi:hypothetical protein